MTGLVDVDLHRGWAGQVQAQRHRAIDVLAVDVDIEAVGAGQRAGRALRASGHRRNRNLVAQALLVVASGPRAIDDRVGRASLEGIICLAAVGVELCAGFLQLLQVGHRLAKGRVERALAGVIDDLAAKADEEGHVVVRVLVDRQLQATLDRSQQFIGGGRNRLDLVGVVEHRHGLQRLRHAVQLAIDLAAFDRNRQQVVEVASHLVVDRREQVGAHFLAQAVVRGNEHVGAAASRCLGLELVVDLVKRNLEHGNLGVGVVFLGVCNQGIDRGLFGATSAIGVPQRHFASDLRASHGLAAGSRGSGGLSHRGSRGFGSRGGRSLGGRGSRGGLSSRGSGGLSSRGRSRRRGRCCATTTCGQQECHQREGTQEFEHPLHTCFTPLLRQESENVEIAMGKTRDVIRSAGSSGWNAPDRFPMRRSATPPFQHSCRKRRRRAAAGNLP